MEFLLIVIVRNLLCQVTDSSSQVKVGYGFIKVKRIPRQWYLSKHSFEEVKCATLSCSMSGLSVYLKGNAPFYVSSQGQ